MTGVWVCCMFRVTVVARKVIFNWGITFFEMGLVCGKYG